MRALQGYRQLEACRAHSARVGDLEFLDPGQGPQALAQVRLVGGRHNGCHAGQAVHSARPQQTLAHPRLQAAVAQDRRFLQSAVSGQGAVGAGMEGGRDVSTQQVLWILGLALGGQHKPCAEPCSDLLFASGVSCMTPGVTTMAGHLQPLRGTACSGCGQAYLPAVLPASYSMLADRAPQLTQQALGGRLMGGQLAQLSSMLQAAGFTAPPGQAPMWCAATQPA